jgi:diguanylate cyclase (GGDEF)-like protein
MKSAGAYRRRTRKGGNMLSKFLHHLSIAYRAACFAYTRSCREGETLEEILGYTDALTGIPNRKAFEEDRLGMHVFETLILFDVDNLKRINDSFGHLFGDAILRSCAEIIRKAAERYGKAYRLSGDEFSVIVPQCWAQPVCLAIENLILEDSRFSVSIGVAPACGAEGLTDDLFKAAERALYRSKGRHPDMYHEFLADISDELKESDPSEIGGIASGSRQQQLMTVETV